jgi:hypothetical protein
MWSPAFDVRCPESEVRNRDFCFWRTGIRSKLPCAVDGNGCSVLGTRE